MAQPHNGRPIQDMPPPGGYKPLNYARYTSKPRMSGATMFLTCAGVISYGFYKVIQGNNYERQLKEEKRIMRVNILPFLEAEEDARYVRANARVVELEKKAMAHVPGWVAGESYFNNKEKWLPNAENRTC